MAHKSSAAESLMINALKELEAILAEVGVPGSLRVIAATFTFGQTRLAEEGYGEREPVAERETYTLMEGFHASLWPEVGEFLNREYENGSGTQELFGTVWLSNGTWLAREAYEGAEWWVHMKCPPLPN